MTPIEVLKMLKSKIDEAEFCKSNYVLQTNDVEAINQALRIHEVGGSTSLSEDEIENQIEMEEYEDSLWNDLEDDLTGLTYPEVDETLFAIESNFPPSNLTEEQWNRERC